MVSNITTEPNNPPFEPFIDELTLVNQYQTEVVSCGELLVDVAEGGRQIKPTKEEPDGNSLASRRGAVHDLSIAVSSYLDNKNSHSFKVALTSNRTNVSLSLY